MNDTHGENGEGWYGFDLDGTLAKYDGWKGIEHIGEPIAPIVNLMKRMHDEGKVVKIVTARVAPRRFEDGTVGEQFTWLTRKPSSDPAAKYTATQYIQDWCEETAHLGFIPEIVYQKDHLMLNLFDDRVTQVEPNTGRILGRLPPELDAYAARRGRYVQKRCERCGEVKTMYSSARCCAECRIEKAKEANRKACIRRAMRG